MVAKKLTPAADQQRGNSGRPARGDNLIERRFRPGQSGNPAGRPKRRTLTERIADILERTARTPGGKELPGGQCVADLLAEAIVQQALKGKFPFFKEIWDRL